MFTMAARAERTGKVVWSWKGLDVDLRMKIIDVGRPNYGHTLIGTKAVEIMRYANCPNITLG